MARGLREAGPDALTGTQAHGGGLKSADSANDPKDFGGKRYGIPFGTSGNLINRRADVLDALRGFAPAGLTGWLVARAGFLVTPAAVSGLDMPLPEQWSLHSRASSRTPR